MFSCNLYKPSIIFMNQRLLKTVALVGFLFGMGLVFLAHPASNIFDPDVEIRINGLVCPSCAIGVKKAFQKSFYVKQLKMDTKKQLLFLEYKSIEIHPTKIRGMVKRAGYEVASIKWLKKKQPNRYNKP